MKSLSLRQKFLITFLSLPVCAIGGYHLIAQKVFLADKSTELFDNSLRSTKDLAELVHREIDHIEREGTEYALKTTSVGPAENLPKVLCGFYSMSYDKTSSRFVPEWKHLTNVGTESAARFASLLPRLQEQLLQSDTQIQIVDSPTRELLFARRKTSDTSGPKELFLFVKPDFFVTIFKKKQLFRNYLVNSENKILFGPREFIDQPLTAILSSSSVERIENSPLPDGSAELKSAGAGNQSKPLIVSFARVEPYGLRVISIADKNTALVQARLMGIKTFLLLITFICLSVIISFFITRNFTQRLEQIFSAMKKIGNGDFDIKLAVRSKDEIGSIADGINRLTNELQRLLRENADKIRIDKELETTRLVQETLLPERSFKAKGYEIHGNSRPADVCGGDWWHHAVIDDQLYVWIGDVTGHGVSAALLTSAMHAATIILESLPPMPVRHIMEMINRAFYQTAKGKVLATLYLGRIDLKTGIMTYTNAGHEWPDIIDPGTADEKRHPWLPLGGAIGPHVGRDPNPTYEEAIHQFLPGQRLFAYTDGLLCIQNKEGRSLPERKLRRLLCDALNKHQDISAAVTDFAAGLDRYRSGARQLDDETFFVLNYDQPSVQ